MNTTTYTITDLLGTSGTFTGDKYEVADWLRAEYAPLEGIEAIAVQMENTGDISEHEALLGVEIA